MIRVLAFAAALVAASCSTAAATDWTDRDKDVFKCGADMAIYADINSDILTTAERETFAYVASSIVTLNIEGDEDEIRDRFKAWIKTNTNHWAMGRRQIGQAQVHRCLREYGVADHSGF